MISINKEKKKLKERRVSNLKEHVLKLVEKYMGENTVTTKCKFLLEQ